jgi:hypothetical protein
MTTTTTAHPDVPVPAGAYIVDDWGDEDHRLIATEPKEVEGTDTGPSSGRL